jgi:hypothetical protein
MTITQSRLLNEIYGPCYSCGWESPTSIRERFTRIDGSRLKDWDLLTDKIIRIEKAKKDFIFESQVWLDGILLEPRIRKISIWDLPRLPKGQVLLKRFTSWRDLHECFTIFCMRLRNLLTWCDHRENHTHSLKRIDYDSMAYSVIDRWGPVCVPLADGNDLQFFVEIP